MVRKKSPVSSPHVQVGKIQLARRKGPIGTSSCHFHPNGSINGDQPFSLVFPHFSPENETSKVMKKPMATNGNHRTKAAHQVEHGPIRVHLCLALSQDLCARAQAEDARLVRLGLGMNSTKIPNAGSILY